MSVPGSKLAQPPEALPTGAPHDRRRWWQSAWFRILLLITFAGIVTAAAAAVYLARNAEPILHKRVIETLSQRFNSPVELDNLHISAARGLEVQGSGLRILYLAGPTQPSGEKNGRPMLTVARFSFHTSLRELLHLRARIATVYVEGLELRVPPHRDGNGLLRGETADAARPGPPPTQPKIALLVDRILCRDAKVFIETDKPGKEPLEFDIVHLDLTDVGSTRPLLYQADIVNPKPRGNVHAFGHLGPWMAADPRATALDGDYRFDHADLNTIKGLGGTLSSTGHFAGELGRIAIEGTTSTPDFSLDISNHPVPLLTSFQALVDGTTGDTTLNHVEATLGRSQFSCAGAILRVKGKGHDIALDVTMPQGRMQDVLQLGMKTEPPMMSGLLTMHAKLHLPPGPVRVAAKLELAGSVAIAGVHFSSGKLQDKIDALSMRAQGRPQDVAPAGSDGRAEVSSHMTANLSLAHDWMTVSALGYDIPGARIDLHGVYGLAENRFEFKGHVRTQAAASQMTTGWKSLLLKAVDPLLKKNGAGVELPIALTGSHGDFDVRLAFGEANESTAQMAADLANQPVRGRAPVPH